MTFSTHLTRILKVLNKVASDDKCMHFLGPFYTMDPFYGDMYNRRQLENIKPLVSMDDWIWDRCGIGNIGEPGVYDYANRLCGDKDNPLYYYQSELLVDDMDSSNDSYYPAITREEAEQHSQTPQGTIHFGMELWDETNNKFWQQWVRQEMKANMDVDLINDGWARNCDGANTFAQNLIWYQHRCASGRAMAGESFYSA